MKTIPLLTLFLFSLFNALSQSPDTVLENYTKAYDELNQMLRGTAPTSLKRAVYLTENAFFDNSLPYQDYLNEIDKLTRLTQAVAASDAPLYARYEGKDRQQLILASSIYRVLKDSLFFEGPDKRRQLIKAPYTYDLEDFWGEQNWTKMFVTKVLLTQTGNCHSLPTLYKILADELGVKAYLALAPNHTYIKQWNDKMGWYNTELTTGQFPVDSEIKWNSYIKTETIAAGIYMDTLSPRETIAYVVTDLAQGYIKKSGYEDINHPLAWLETALQYYPDYINALILKAELKKKLYEKAMAEKGARHFSKLWKDRSQKSKFDELEQEYLRIHQLGYRRMPKEMYLNWLFRAQKDSTHKAYTFSNPQPFKKYKYNAQIMTAGNGENYEFFDQDTVVQIGTVLLNVISNKIAKFVEYQPEEIPDEVISRMYDPAIGRFWQVDPLAEKFHPASPYNYAFNNPTNIVDPDGRSGEPVVDEKNKTITVNMHFVFYGTGATDDNMKSALNTINKMWNANADKKTGWSDAGDGWRIKVVATGEITDESGAHEIADNNEGNSLYNYVRVEETNEADGVRDPNTGIVDHKVSFLRGKSGFWITQDMKRTTPAHESGHGLGLDLWHINKDGINNPGTENRRVSLGNLSEIRANILENGTDKSSLIDKYISGIKRVNYGSTNTTIYAADGTEKN